ncbi:hypothetical protein [Streptomyces sp. NPDC058045]|uniref:hypothetical protein n=1 Tax=Streptomyces sp. NPDC058045 TaxID=3346311 RepID=UPI0036E92C24
MAFDVDGARRVVARVLDDKLEVWRDSAGRTDDVLHENTGRLVPPSLHRTVLHQHHVHQSEVHDLRDGVADMCRRYVLWRIALLAQSGRGGARLPSGSFWRFAGEGAASVLRAGDAMAYHMWRQSELVYPHCPGCGRMARVRGVQPDVCQLTRGMPPDL